MRSAPFSRLLEHTDALARPPVLEASSHFFVFMFNFIVVLPCSGPIPKELGNLEKLEHLGLGSNKLTGEESLKRHAVSILSRNGSCQRAGE